MKTVLRVRNWSDKEFALATNTRFDGPRMWTHAPGRTRLHRIAFIFAESQLHDLATNDIYWDKVVEVVSIGRREIADFNEEMGHAVVLQGILVRPELN
jgi:replicative DNA helicase